MNVMEPSDRIQDLKENLRKYVKCFSDRQEDPATALFTGPSVYFHKRTLQRLDQVGLEAVLASDEVEFFELLYATLASWGMHRMGPGGAKLVEFSAFRSSIVAAKDDILALKERTLTEVDDQAPGIIEQLVPLMQRLSISASGTKMIAFTKAIHHLLPRLVPPVDRQYTLRFFYAPGKKTSNIDQYFPEVYRWCNQIATANSDVIADLVKGWDDLGSTAFDTGEAKLVDNAIVGYVLEKFNPALNSKDAP